MEGERVGFLIHPRRDGPFNARWNVRDIPSVMDLTWRMRGGYFFISIINGTFVEQKIIFTRLNSKC